MVTIAELRAKHNKMSQRELAKELGVTQTSISNWEKDQTKISCEYLISLALFFDVSTDDILGINKQATQKF
ncbi:TPA: helix-turn-helix transcriptional regulator [Streptococcus pyogenes]|nr:helix-turn-helix transcriptional regulator [Streptococcus pyogenes]